MWLYLIRHPQPAIAPGVCYGQLDVALLQPVNALATQLTPELPPANTALVYSSPLQRCTQLATTIYSNVLIDARLAEINFGAWEGQTWEAIHQADPNALDAWAADLPHFRPPQGESASEMQQRLRDWLNQATETAHAARKSHLVAFTHAGAIRLLLADQQHLSLHTALQIPIPYGSVQRLEIHSITD